LNPHSLFFNLDADILDVNDGANFKIILGKKFNAPCLISNEITFVAIQVTFSDDFDIYEIHSVPLLELVNCLTKSLFDTLFSRRLFFDFLSWVRILKGRLVILRAVEDFLRHRRCYLLSWVNELNFRHLISSHVFIISVIIFSVQFVNCLLLFFTILSGFLG
jgi:hypothetical protein